MDYNKAARSESRVHSAQYNEGLRAYMLRIYNYMTVALAITGLVAYLASSSEALMGAIYGTPLQYVVMLAPLGIVMYLSMRINKLSVASAQTWFWVYAGVMGLSLSFIFLVYTGASIARCFFITASVFGSMSLYGYTTKKDLTGMGSFLIMGLFGIILASIVNIFLKSSGLEFAISALGVLIFTGLTAYDTQKLKQVYYMAGGNAEQLGKAAIMGALTLYLDFINLMIMLLRFVGDRR
jgi:uncharacterized protein